MTGQNSTRSKKTKGTVMVTQGATVIIIIIIMLSISFDSLF